MPEGSVFLALSLPSPVEAQLRERRDVIAGRPTEPLTRAMLGDARSILLSVETKLDAAAIADLPDSVRAIATYSVGHDHIDIVAAEARGLVVLNTPDVLTNAVAEVAILLMLGAARRATESIDLLRGGRWTGWTPTQLPGVEVTGRRIGIFGMGRIGQRVAERARGFGMEVHYRSRHRLPDHLEQGAIYHDDERSFLSASDVLMIACAATAETTGFLNATRIDALPPDAIVVNISRGAIVEDDALIAALSTGRLAAAGLDVFTGEPALDPRYLDLPNAFLLPHIGSSTMTARHAMMAILLDGLDLLDEGKTPPNRVRPPQSALPEPA